MNQKINKYSPAEVVRGNIGISQLLNRYLLIICAIVLVVMVVVANWQVLSRYIIGSPSKWSDEALRFLLIWLTLLGAPLAHGLNRQMAVSFLTDKFNLKWKKIDSVVIEVIVLIFAIFVLIIGGVMVVGVAINQFSPSLGISMGLIYSALPISGVLFTIYSSDRIREQLSKKKKTTVETEEK